MQRRIQDTDFTVGGYVDQWGSGLDPDLLHFGGIQLVISHASHEDPESHAHKMNTLELFR